MMTDPNRRTFLKVLGGAGVLIAAGATGSVSARGTDAKIRVAHAVPDAPAVDILVNGSVAVPNVAFGDVSGYLEVPADEYEITINVAGTSTTVDSITVELMAEDYTAIAIGNLEPEGSEPGFALDLFQDKLGVLAPDEGRVRIYHASPDAPAVDVAVADGNDEPAVYLAQNLAFGNAGPNVEVAAGTYPVAVYAAGDTDPVFGPVDVEVVAGEVLTVFAMGELEPEGSEPGFGPVLASEMAAPFGRGRGRGRAGSRRGRGQEYAR